MEKKFLVGSNYFFSCYEDFHAKDVDELIITETGTFKYLSQLQGKGYDIFRLKKQPDVDTYINMAIEYNLGMAVGKFLIPEFCEAIGMTVRDLPKLQPLIDILDNKHKYEKVIYEAYLNNQSFTLTDAQRKDAYKVYKQERKLTNE